MQELWNISNIVVHTRIFEVHKGENGKLFVNAAGEPVLLQVRNGTQYTHIPWCDVRYFVGGA